MSKVRVDSLATRADTNEIPVSDIAAKSDLAAPGGAALVGYGGGTVADALEAAAPITTQGDLVVGGAGGAPERLPKGVDGKVLTMVSGAPAWGDVAGGGGTVDEIIAGAGIAVDSSDPANPSVSWKAPTVVAEAGTSLLATAANAGRYTRFTAASAKTYTFNSTETYTVGDEYHVRNIGAGNLTLTPAGSFVLNAPADGTLVIPQGGTATVKIVGAAEADVFGVTVAP